MLTVEKSKKRIFNCSQENFRIFVKKPFFLKENKFLFSTFEKNCYFFGRKYSCVMNFFSLRKNIYLLLTKPKKLKRSGQKKYFSFNKNLFISTFFKRNKVGFLVNYYNNILGFLSMRFFSSKISCLGKTFFSEILSSSLFLKKKESLFFSTVTSKNLLTLDVKKLLKRLFSIFYAFRYRKGLIRYHEKNRIRIFAKNGYKNFTLRLKKESFFLNY